MAYDDTGFETIFENDGGDEGWDREWNEAFPKYSRAYKPGGRTLVSRPAAPKPISGIRGGTITTPGGGRSQVTLPAAVASKEAVDAAIKELKLDIAKQAEAIRKVDQTLDTNTSMLDKKINGVTVDLKKMQSQSQFSTMLPLLLTSTPKLESFTQKGSVTPTLVDDSKFKSSDNTGLLLAMMAMGGGLGGSGDNNNSAMMMALALGAFK